MNAYQNPFLNPYNYTQQFQQLPQFQQTMQMPQQVVKVHGEEGARAYQIGANSSVLLLDETNPIVWLKVTDGASYPTITPYKIEPYKNTETAKKVDTTKLEERICKLEEKVFKPPVKKIVESE